MTRQANWNDLEALEAIDKKVAEIREALRAVAALDGVAGALALVDRLEEAVTDIAADVELALHERGAERRE
ncbi:MAG: hypothetical protein JXA57_20760 [Armatimonadetes bacterium]|nr:hypothetical protein [Armatimonadota bacterium]